MKRAGSTVNQGASFLCLCFVAHHLVPRFLVLLCASPGHNIEMRLVNLAGTLPLTSYNQKSPINEYVLSNIAFVFPNSFAQALPCVGPTAIEWVLFLKVRRADRS